MATNDAAYTFVHPSPSVRYPLLCALLVILPDDDDGNDNHYDDHYVPHLEFSVWEDPLSNKGMCSYVPYQPVRASCNTP